ncbi:MAG: hypothetical protein QG665_332 [Patescibacteria group bacterium]|nr:hypothetical protein [Patescibacteria group bacterium]
MPQIFVDNTKPMVDPNFPLRWCLCPGELEELRKKKAQNIYLVISIVWGGREVDRLLYPIDQVMTYINLRRAGTHTLNAFVVFCDDDSGHISENWCPGKSYIKKGLGSKNGHGQPDHNLYDGNGDLNLENISCFQGGIGWLLEASSVDIVVNEEFFAPEPPAWEQRWVNMFFSRGPVDQCAYRRRRIFAYTIQPFVVFIMWAWFVFTRTTVLLMSIFLMRRHWDIAPILTPWEYRFKDVWDPPSCDYWSFENDIVFTDKDGKERSFWFVLLHPVLWVCVATLATFVYFIAWPMMMKLAPVVWEIRYYLMGFLTTFGVYGLFRLKRWLNPALYKIRDEERERKAEQRRLERQDEYYTISLSELSCEHGRQLPVKISALPPSRKTLRLRFYAVKNAVCRPFSLK